MKYKIVLVTGVENHSMMSFSFNYRGPIGDYKVLIFDFPELEKSLSYGQFLPLPEKEHSIKLNKLFNIAQQAKRTLVIATHSEHMFNALRLMVLNKIILPEECIIYFIDENKVVNEITINQYGNPIAFRTGFFDQAVNDSCAILRHNLRNRENRKAQK